MTSLMHTARGVVTLLFAATFVGTFLTTAAAADGVTTSGTGTTRLYVRTMPPGATVTVDGTSVGQSDGLFLVPAGTTKVTVQFAGQEPQVLSVDVTEGQIARLEVAARDAGVAVEQKSQEAADERTAEAGGWVRTPHTKVPFCTLISRRPRGPEQPLTKFEDVLAKPVKYLKEVPGFGGLVQSSCGRVSPGWIGLVRHAAVDLSELTGVNISVDESTGPAVVEILGKSGGGLSLEQTLDALCSESKLAWVATEDGLRITPASTISGASVEHVYDVTDLCADRSQTQSLAYLIESMIAADSWESGGGFGTIKVGMNPAGDCLIVSQSFPVHRRVTSFLGRLRSIKQRLSQADTMPRSIEARRLGDCWDSSLMSELADPSEFQHRAFSDVEAKPLVEVLDSWFGQYGDTFKLPRSVPTAMAAPIRSRVSRDCLDRRGVPHDVAYALISLKARSLSAAQVLDRLLSPLQLTYSVDHDRLLVITKDADRKLLSTAIYPVDTVSINGRIPSPDELVERLTSGPMRKWWESHGGPGTVRAVGGDIKALVVNQTTTGHIAVDAFLQSLR